MRWKNEKISYYELLRMIKEGKQPKEIIFSSNTLEWNGKNYVTRTRESYLSSYINEINMFDKNIEIPVQILDKQENEIIIYCKELKELIKDYPALISKNTLEKHIDIILKKLQKQNI